MERKSHMPLKVFLWVISIYHLAAGLAATFSQQLAIKMGSLLFGVQISATGEAQLLIRYLGVFGITFGILMAFAALNPEKNKSIIYGGIIYFAVRALDRILFWKLLQEYSIGPLPNWGRIIVILIMGLALFILRPKSE